MPFENRSCFVLNMKRTAESYEIDFPHNLKDRNMGLKLCCPKLVLDDSMPVFKG